MQVLYRFHKCSVPFGDRFQESVPRLKKGWEALIQSILSLKSGWKAKLEDTDTSFIKDKLGPRGIAFFHFRGW